MQEKHGASCLRRDVLQLGHKPRHLPVVVFVKGMDAAQGVEDEQAGVGADLDDAGKMRFIQDIQALT